MPRAWRPRVPRPVKCHVSPNEGYWKAVERGGEGREREKERKAMEELAGVDVLLLAATASEFASYPGLPSDAAAQRFLQQFPLPVLLSALERGDEAAGLESSVVSSLEKIFRSGYGMAVLPHAVQFANVGLNASSASVRRLTCDGVAILLENSDKDGEAAVQAVAESHIASPLLLAVADADATVAKAATEALVNLAKSRAGLELIFTDKGAGAGRLKEMALDGLSTVRMRTLSMAGTIFGLSEAAAAAIQESGVLSVLEMDLDNDNDMLAQLTALELLCELAATPDGIKFLLAGNLIERLTSTFGHPKLDPLVRSRAMAVASRLMSLFDSPSSPISVSESYGIVHALDQHLEHLTGAEESARVVDGSEHEAALDALSQIGMTVRGAELQLRVPSPVARHITEAAFLHRGDGIQLAGIHALASLVGSERTLTSVLLNEDAEACLKDLIYSAAAERSATLTPAGLFWSLLPQSPEVRVATYRLIQPLVARTWCLRELCSHKDLIDFIVDPRIENSKGGMDWRHTCCVSVATALAAAGQRGEVFSTDVLNRLEDAVRKGPYPFKEQNHARPIVATQERM